MSGNIMYICHTFLGLLGGFVSRLGEYLNFCLQRSVEFGSWRGRNFYCCGMVESIACTIMSRYYYWYVVGTVGALVLGYFCK